MKFTSILLLLSVASAVRLRITTKQISDAEIAKVFTKLDTDGSGQVEGMEAYTGLKDLAANENIDFSDGSDANTKMWNEWNKADKENDGNFTKEQFNNLWKAIYREWGLNDKYKEEEKKEEEKKDEKKEEEKKEEEKKEEENKMDDNSFDDKKEEDKIKDDTDTEIAKVFKQLDTDGNGLLEQHEVLKGVQDLAKEKNIDVSDGSENYEKVGQAFRKADKNSDGSFDEQEFNKFARDLIEMWSLDDNSSNDGESSYQVEVKEKMDEIADMRPKVSDMERRLNMMRKVQPELQDAIKVLKMVTDTSQMGTK